MRRTIIDRRYKILKKLGAGAMGEVYKVKDLKNDNIIALKLLSRKKTSSEIVQRFKREFKLLAELRHPNLCEVYDFGTLKDGRSYFTMEYIDGENIFEAAKRLSYKKIYPWIVELCRVLEYIHSKGLIHYDIKPGNVLIAKGKEHRAKSKEPYAQISMSQVKLMDFGLVGEQKIRGGILIKGTLPYIAPEVIKGLAVDHRADLYSLGVLLYEIFTRKPLQVDVQSSFAILLKQSRNHIVTKSSKYVPDIPKGLRRLIIKLIDSEPAGRLSRANEVIREINKISHTQFALETEKTIEGYLLSSRFVGRNKEMELLKSSYAKARRGDGKVILVTGDGGVGKSRLLKEFKIYIQTEHGHCIIGYASKDKILPLEPFYNVFKELMSYIGEMPARFWTKERKLWLAVLFRMFPELTVKRLGKNLPKLVPLDLKQENLRTFGALTELITHCTNQLGEMVILLEDLHWADDVTIQFLEYLGRNLNGKNILICGTSRMTELKENEVFKSIIDNMKKEGYLKHIELKPFTYKNLYSFLNSTITSTSNSSRLTRYLMSKTDGNPFFVEETIRTLLQMGKMKIGKRVEIAKLKKITIPQTVADVALKRIVDLDENSRKIINFAAILLKDFSFDLMKRLTGLEDTESAYSLWELKRRGVLVEQDRRYQFYHAILREAIDKRMAYREKRKFYYQVGKTLEIIHKKNKEKVVEDMAYHYINAKHRKKGIQYGLRAAQKSRERYANEQAIRFYRGVLDLLGNRNRKRRFDILLRMVHIESKSGLVNDAIKHYKKALSLKTGTIYKRIRVYAEIGKIYERKGEYRNALYIYQRAKRLVEKMKPGTLENVLKTYINVSICNTFQRIGDYKSVNKFNFNAVKLSPSSSMREETIELISAIYGTIGNIEYQKCIYSTAHFDRAIYYYKQSYKYHKQINVETCAAVLTNLGLCYYMMHDYQMAIECYRKSIRISKRTGDQYNLTTNLFNIGLIFLHNKGYYLNALEKFNRALIISRKIGNSLAIGASVGCRGLCFLKLCDYMSAKENFEKALKIFNTLDLKRRKAFPLRGLGEIYQVQGDYTLALRFYRRALKVSKDFGDQYNICDSSINISATFVEIGEFSKAISFLADISKIAIAIKPRQIGCYLVLCRINIVLGHYTIASGYCEKGMKMINEYRNIQYYLCKFLSLSSEIYYYRKKYLKGIKIANRALVIAKKMGTRDLYTETLVMKAKNEIKRGVLSKIEILTILNEAKRIAEEINCPELLWKVYFCYGQFLHKDKQYLKASEYYRKCHTIFKDVGSKIKNKNYQNSYFAHPARQKVYVAIDEIEKLVRAGG